MSKELNGSVYEQLNFLGDGFGWASKILLNSFKISGLESKGKHQKPSQVTTLQNVYTELQKDERTRFKETVLTLSNNKDAVKLLTESIRSAHGSHGVREIDEADVIINITAIAINLDFYIMKFELD